jgi:hypothetical protein
MWNSAQQRIWNLAEKSQSQRDKFKSLAKQVEADQDEAAFKKRLGKIAKPPKPKK